LRRDGVDALPEEGRRLLAVPRLISWRISVSRRPSTVIWKAVATTGSSTWRALSASTSAGLLRMLAWGGEIVTRRPNTVDIAVAAEPIIWFMASEAALSSSSPSSSFAPLPSPPIIRSAMTPASCSFTTSRFEPESPSVKATSMIR
jgi:hypothetical protein